MHGEGHVAAALLENTYQLRLAIVAAALPLGFMGLAICGSSLGRRRPVVTGVTVGVLYWTSVWLEQDAAKALMSSGRFFPESLVAWMAWTPNIVLLIAASAILRVRGSAVRLQQ
jgi:lipopolysaccharide export LptBFGC system permease protein LptF